LGGKNERSKNEKEIRKTNPSSKRTIASPPEGKVWILHQSGDKLLVPEWLAEDLIRRGKQKEYEKD
jgi:hypothetical protein